MEAEPRVSMLQWLFSSLGWTYIIQLPLAGLIAFVVIVLVLARGRGWAAGAAAVLAPLMPLLLGLWGTVEGLMQTLIPLGMSNLAPKPNEIAEGVSMSLVTTIVGFVLTAPNYLLAVFGLLARGLMEPKEKSSASS